MQKHIIANCLFNIYVSIKPSECYGTGLIYVDPHRYVFHILQTILQRRNQFLISLDSKETDSHLSLLQYF